ncbi:hypothetical protein GCM10009809_21800 [Isoptericola hypogeus]|uniref:CopC domain-containing protein n=1 Tax=Isoptericola hypogeus TaxID=300179 RepID=A0ABN2JFT4_9MICO
MPRPVSRRRPALSVAAAFLALGASLLGAAALTVAAAGPAAAHDRLISSDPKDGARVKTPPSQLTLTFSADVLEQGAQVVVSTPDGSVDGDVSVDGEVVTAELPGELPAGEYDVLWRVVSSDGHPIEGELSYEATAAAQPAEEPEPSPSPTSASPTGDPTDDPTGAPSPDATGAPSDDAAGHAGHATGTPGAELDGDGEAGWTAVWLFGVAVLAAVGVAAAMVLRRRRLGEGPDDTAGDRTPHDPADDQGPADGHGPADGPDRS